MKKVARNIVVLTLLGTWAMIAIGSGQSHSHRCNGEWKKVFPGIDAQSLSKTKSASKNLVAK